MPVTTATLLPDADGSRRSPSERRYRCVWQVHTTDPLDTAAVVLASPLLPQLGDPFTGWTYADGVYTPKAGGDIEDANAVVVDRVPKLMGQDSPFVWEVTITYEGTESPLATPPDVDYSETPYQEQVIQDRRRGFIMNSAGDLYDGGVTKDMPRGVLTITRNVAYDAFDPDLADQFRNSLNESPFPHGGLERFVPGPTPSWVPLTSPSCTAKLRSLHAARRVRLQNPSPASARYYWQVTAVIEFDYSTFTNTQGQRVPKLWRKVLPDVGYNYLAAGKKRPIILANGPATTPQLLDGRGGVLKTYGVKPAASTPFTPDPDSPAVVAQDDDFYQAVKGTPLTVANPGVLGNDSAGGGDPALRKVNVIDGPVSAATGLAAGTVTLNNSGVGGGFTYTPPADADFRGWVTWTYNVTNTALDPLLVSNTAKVFILVADQQVPVNVFEVYDPLDWTPIAPFIGGW